MSFLRIIAGILWLGAIAAMGVIVWGFIQGDPSWNYGVLGLAVAILVVGAEALRRRS